MGTTPPPSRATPTASEAGKPPQSAAAWPGFIERMTLVYGDIAQAPVIDRLPRHDEVDLDSYLATGIDINEACMDVANQKLTPLFLAISRRCPPLVNALLARGASISMRSPNVDNSYLSPTIKESGLVCCLLSYTREDNPHAAAILKALLNAPGVQLQEEINDPSGSMRHTPLSICIQMRNAMARDVLMANGADATCRDKEGRTLLHLLAHKTPKPSPSLENEDAWLRWVLNSGTSFDAIDIHGDTPLDLARKFRPKDGFVNLLESVMAERQSSELDRKTPLAAVATRAPSRRI